MYAVGGCDENNVRQNTVEKYSPGTDTWTMICPMASTRSSACVVGCYDLYVIGGVNFYGMSLNSVEKYDPSTDTWCEVSSLTNKRASACGAFCNGKIYVIGKLLDSVNTNTNYSSFNYAQTAPYVFFDPIFQNCRVFLRLYMVVTKLINFFIDDTSRGLLNGANQLTTLMNYANQSTLIYNLRSC